MTRLTVFTAFLLSACSAEVGAVDGPLYREEFASVEGVLQAIETCRGFSSNWDQWLEARESDGWIVTKKGETTRPSRAAPNYRKNASLSNDGLLIEAYLERMSEGYVGLRGRCDVVAKVAKLEDFQRVSQQVRERMNRIRPDWNGLTYLPNNEKLGFNRQLSVEDGMPINIYIQLNYDDTVLTVPK